MSVAPNVPTGQMFCSECGRSFPPEDLARFGTNAVCADCKPRFVQRMQEGVASPLRVQYGGFWRRFLAVVLDGIIIAIITFPFQMALALFMPRNTTAAMSVSVALGGGIYLLSLIFNVAYYTWFISQKGATPGKMVMGLRVVTASGGPLTVAHAAGRFFAQILSGLTFLIGYIIAAFDDQKRALHDHICGTRVIRQA